MVSFVLSYSAIFLVIAMLMASTAAYHFQPKEQPEGKTITPLLHVYMLTQFLDHPSEDYEDLEAGKVEDYLLPILKYIEQPKSKDITDC